MLGTMHVFHEFMFTMIILFLQKYHALALIVFRGLNVRQICEFGTHSEVSNLWICRP